MAGGVGLPRGVTMRTKTDRRRRSWWFGVLLIALPTLAVLASVPSWAEEEAPAEAEEEEPVLKGEAKRKHQAEVKRHLAYILERKTQDLLERKIEEVGAEGTRAARDALIKFSIGRKSKRYVKAAFLALGGIGGKTTRDFLCGKHALLSKDVLVAQFAADALGTMGDPRATGPLLDVLTNRRTKTLVIGACAQALAKCAARDEKATEVVFEFSRHKKSSIRGPVVEGLGYFGTDEATARLEEVLTGDANAEVRAAAARGFGHANRSEAVPLLRKAAGEDRSASVRKACLAAIVTIQGDE